MTASIFCRATVFRLGISFTLVFLMLVGVGCTGANVGDGGNGGNGGNNGGTPDSFRVSFDAEGGHYAVAEDEDGNEYAFRAMENNNGDMLITEANVRASNGETLKVSLDPQGRPVNFRLSNNTNADIVYQNNMAMIRLTDAQGNVSEGQAERLLGSSAQETPSAAQSNPSENTQALRAGLSTYGELTFSLFDSDDNPDSPLAGSEFELEALLIAEIVDGYDVEEVDATLLINATIDEIPDAIQQLAGQTFILFDAEGLCLQQTGAANRLTFDLNSVLQSEFDRNVVFPDFGLGETRDSGITINYSTGTPINLTPGGTDVSVFLTPVFTGTQLDDFGFITIERRFEADSEYVVETVAGQTTANAHQLFDAALTAGTLSDDGIVLEFELQLIDLLDENPVRRAGLLRYYNQNAVAPDTQFVCEVIDDYDDGYSGINCPGTAEVATPFTVDYVFSREDEGRELIFDWFVSDGLGFVSSDPFESGVEVLPTGPGVIQVSVIVSDITGGSVDSYKQYVCETVVGDVFDDVTDPLLLSLGCPAGLNVGDFGVFRTQGTLADELELTEWFVAGSRAFVVVDPFDSQTQIQFFQPGRFNVGFTGYDLFGTEYFSSCEVIVGGTEYDVCDVNGYYGDGICDEFCLFADEDCGDEYFDLCEINGFYGDGICDPFCLFEDEDCSGDFGDICDTAGFYGDGTCDLFCPEHDPDCDQYDVCEAYGWYGDGVCDSCILPDPDCEEVTDICAQRGWYGDGECDSYCPMPDPDCEVIDVCDLYGFYGDGQCDDFCRLPDPDCADVTDICAINGLYGDGICHENCDMYDPDCTDICFEQGLYGDGVCDVDCQYPDPDCDEIDECELMGFYGDGICDAFCPLPDPDCENIEEDVCETNGWYGDGICDEFCLLPDPDCE